MDLVDDKEFVKLEQKIGYCFRDKLLLLEAMTHPSLKQENCKLGGNYEKLEFLGDSVLSLVIAEIVTLKTLENKEGALAKIKAYLVSSEVVSSVGKDINIDKFIVMSKGEEKCGGRRNNNNIENATEALIGAIYLDSGIESARKLIEFFWDKYLHDEELMNSFDTKSTLQNITQSLGIGIPSYEIIERQGSDHAPIFTVQVSAGKIQPQIGIGSNRKDAEKRAASEMIKSIKKIEFSK